MRARRIRRVPRNYHNRYSNYSNRAWDGDAMPPERPTGIALLALLNLLTAILGILLVVVSLLALPNVSSVTLIPDDIAEADPLSVVPFFIDQSNQEDRENLRLRVGAFAIADLVIFALSSILGLGLLRLRPWARWLGIISYGAGVVLHIGTNFTTAMTGASIMGLVIGVTAFVYLLTPRIAAAFDGRRD